MLLLVAIGVRVSLWCRPHRRRIQLSREEAGDVEENIPLQSTSAGDLDEFEPEHTQQKRKGKGQKTKIDEGTPIFDVGRG